MPLPLKKTPTGHILFLSKVNYGQILTAIRCVLGPNAPFAPITISGQITSWSNPDPSRKYYPLSEAPDRVKGEVGMLRDILFAQWRTLLEPQKLAAVLTVPDDSYIYYSENTANDGTLESRYSLMITGWACSAKKTGDQGSDSLEKDVRLAKDRHQLVKVRCVDGVGAPLAGKAFRYVFQGKEKQTYTADANGGFSLGICLVGEKCAFVNLSTGQERSFVVQKNQEVYELVYAPMPVINVTVVNQAGAPMQSLPVSFTYGSEQRSCVTDGLGRCTVSDLLYLDPGLHIGVKAGDGAQQTFPVTCPVTEITVRVHVVLPVKPRLVTRREGQPVPDVTLLLEGDVVGSYCSDTSGEIALPELMPGATFQAVYTDTDGTKTQHSYTIEENRELYPFDLPSLPQKEEKPPVPPVPPVPEGPDVPDVPDVPEPPEAPEVECHLLAIDGATRQPVADWSLRVTTPLTDGVAITDAQGIVPLGKLKPGDSISVAVSDAPDATVNFIVEEGKEEYVVEIDSSLPLPPPPPLPDITVTQLERDRQTPIPGARITLINAAGQQCNSITDRDGSIVAPRAFFTDGQKFKAHVEIPGRSVRDTSLKFSADCSHYILYLTDPFKWKRLLWLLLPLLLLLLCCIKCERDITVEAVTRTQGQPVAGAVVALAYTEHALFKNGDIFFRQQHTLSGVTDSTGCYRFEGLPCSVYSYIFYTLHQGRAFADNGCDRNQEDFFFHWARKVTVELTPCTAAEPVASPVASPVAPPAAAADTLPQEPMARIRVVDAATGSPLPGAAVNLTEPDGKKISGTTDGDGCFSVPGGSKYDEVVATAPGYSGALLRNQPINEGEELKIPLGRPNNLCGTEVNNTNRDKGNLALQDFDAGGVRNVRIFYFTDTAPDAITVYDCSSADLMKSDRNSKTLFHYSGATNDTGYQPFRYKDFTISSPTICVEVKGGTNWGYRLECLGN